MISSVVTACTIQMVEGYLKVSAVSFDSLADQYFARKSKKKKIRYLNCICHYSIFVDKNSHTLPITNLYNIILARLVQFMYVYPSHLNGSDSEVLLVLRKIKSIPVMASSLIQKSMCELFLGRSYAGRYPDLAE